MTAFVGIVAFLIILAVLILIHELGHFTFAKLTGVQVNEFGLGFPPRVRSWRRGSTVYSLNAIPLGGFVRMQGENGSQDEPGSFGSKAPWQRLIILAAGPAMNLSLALLLFFIVYAAGSPRLLSYVATVQPNSPAAAAGLRPGDQIAAIDGKHVTYADGLLKDIQKNLGKHVSLLIRRNGADVVTTLVPRVHPPAKQGHIGVLLNVHRTVTVRHSPGDALQLAFGGVGSIASGVPDIVKSLIHHSGPPVSGPIGIAQATTTVVQNEPTSGFGSILGFVALLSASLGIFNLLPIPALDGGRIVFVLVSWVRRRNVNPEVEGIIHVVGMAALLLLIMVISYQDIIRWASGKSF